MPRPSAPTPRPILSLAALALAMLLASLGTSIANVALPTLAASFAASFDDVRWVVLAYLLAITGLSLGVGRLGDVLGRRRVLLWGIALFTLASIAAGAAPSLGLLVAARAVQGAGAAMMTTLVVAMVGETLPKARIGGAMGLLGTMSAIGTALGPALGGFAIAVLGWPAVFLLGVPGGVVAFVLAAVALPADAARPVERRSIDIAGMSLVTVAAGAYALAVTGAAVAVAPAILVAASLVALGLLVLVERRAAAPLVDLATLARPGLVRSLFANLVVATVMMATLVVGPFHLSRSLGLDAAAVGLALSIGPVISAATGVVAGGAVDRFGPEATVRAGLATMIVGAALLAATADGFGLAGWVVGLALLTPGYQLFQAANTTGAMADLPADRRGAVAGLLALARNLGFVSGAALMGTVFALTSGAADAASAGAAEVTRGFTATFALAAVGLAVALAVVVVRRPATLRKSSS